MAETDRNRDEGRMLGVQKPSLDGAGASRLEPIRASIAGDRLAVDLSPVGGGA